MSLRTRVSFCMALTTAALLIPAATARADTLISPQEGYNLSAFGGVLAWETEAGLFFHMNGVNQAAAVPAQGPNYDPDVGPGLDGTPVIVYSRCPPGEDTCDAYELDPGTGPAADQRIDSISAEDADETEVTVWIGRYAFQRCRGTDCKLFSRRAESKKRRIKVKPAGDDASLEDLRGKSVALRVFGEEDRIQIVKINRKGGKRCTVARSGLGGGFDFPRAEPKFDGNFLYWTEENEDTPIHIVRTARGGRCSELEDEVSDRSFGFSGENPLRLAVDGGTIFYSKLSTEFKGASGIRQADAPPPVFSETS